MGERTKVQVRSFRREDQEAALALQDEFIEEFFPEFVGDPRLHEWNKDVYDIYSSYIEGDGIFWVVERDMEVVGMGGIKISEGAPVISRVRVRKTERGKGLGPSSLSTWRSTASGKDTRRFWWTPRTIWSPL